MSLMVCVTSFGLGRFSSRGITQVQRTLCRLRSSYVCDNGSVTACVNARNTGNVIPRHYHKNKRVATLQKVGLCFIQSRGFHVTPKRNIPPVFWLFIKPVAKLGAILSGRTARKWWQGLPTKKRQHFWDGVRERWYLIALAGAGLCGLGVVYYEFHVEETPLTGRQRFIAVTHKQFMKIAHAEAEEHLKNYEDKLLPPSHPYYERVLRVEKRLVQANPEIKKLMGSTSWKCYVIDEPTTINAFVLPTGHVFVFTGIIDFAQNDDQLAIIIAHEMAHALLSHGIEQVSYTQLLDFFIIATMAAIWCILPTDGFSLITQWFYEKVINLMLHMPYSRMLEKEADKVGLELAARACYDVREGSVFWTRMGLNDEMSDEKVPEWLSTHPSFEKRVELFEFLIPKAIELRADSQCSTLPKRDPRESIKMLSAMVDDHLTAKKTGQNLSRVKVLTPHVPVAKSS
ncbi:hypothetical protein ACOMHN_034122 [Nucella lapillus]